MKQVYYAYAQSQILYSLIIWGASPHLQTVFVAQKRVIRAMAGKRYWRSNSALESCKPLFEKFGILTVYSLYIFECLKFLMTYPEKFVKAVDGSENAKRALLGFTIKIIVIVIYLLPQSN